MKSMKEYIREAKTVIEGEFINTLAPIMDGWKQGKPKWTDDEEHTLSVRYRQGNEYVNVWLYENNTVFVSWCDYADADIKISDLHKIPGMVARWKKQEARENAA